MVMLQWKIWTYVTDGQFSHRLFYDEGENFVLLVGNDVCFNLSEEWSGVKKTKRKMKTGRAVDLHVTGRR